MRFPARASQDPSERPVPDRFESFDLAIERIDQSYRAQITDSPVGPRPPVRIDAARLDPGEPIPGEEGEPTRDVRRRVLDRDDLRRLGERLFSAVFVDGVAEAFRASVERVRSQGFGLRVHLRLDEAPELAGLPWEALWDPTARAFLADRPDLSVVRALRVTAGTPVVRPSELPLRLLALLPEPRGESKLGSTTEWQRIRERLAPLIEQGTVQVERLEPATLEALGRRLEDRPCHVLHVVAHGAPGDPRAGGLLKLEDASGQPDSVSGIDLARALERRRAPRLVVLNACHGARAAADDAFDGMAQHLLSRGVPAVVAMRTAISDAAAVSFAAELYGELAQGRTVEAAMVEARRALSLGEHRSEWATPVLYMRGESAQIFEGSGSVPRARRPAGPRRRRVAGTTLTAAAAAALGLLMWPRGEDPCPPPSGLQDLRFVKIEAGVVDLGDRSVTVKKGYCIGTKELSRRDWYEVMGGDGTERLPNLPMTHVTIDDVKVFLNKLEARDHPGVIYRLPTAAEWEYAARARSRTDYFFGDDPSELHQFGNCKNNQDDDHDLLAPVGSYKPSQWGLYDVHGNVAEWVEWPEDAGLSRKRDGKIQALRLGGSFNNVPGNCTSGSQSTVDADKDDRDDTGFRVVRELNVEEEPP